MDGDKMKRLIRKALDPGTLGLEKDLVNPPGMEEMKRLDQLSEADVRHDRCPVCKYNPLLRDVGFKYCPNCEAVFKILDGAAYQVEQINQSELKLDEN
jgi:ribosomal protein L37AE/L43A